MDAEKVSRTDSSRGEAAVADRDAIGRATGILMERHGISPEEALHRLRRMSRDASGELQEIAAFFVETHRSSSMDLTTRRDVAVAKVSLSSREVEVLDALARGLSNRAIGAELYISVNSVKTHVRNVFRKIGVATRAQAAIWAHQHEFTTAARADERGADA